MKKIYDNTIIRRADYNDATAIMDIIVERSNWLKNKQIKQWESFLERDITYYTEKIEKETVYVVIIDECVCGTFLLQSVDKYWEEDDEAFYIHHLAVKQDYPGLGKYIINQIKNMAIDAKKNYIRIDHVQENKKLNSYYEELGFEIKKELYDGMYHCLLREMQLAN